jgi:hypothetical protein
MPTKNAQHLTHDDGYATAAGPSSTCLAHFLSLVLLLAVCLLAWVQTFRSLELSRRRAKCTPSSLAGQPDVALQHTDPIARVSHSKPSLRRA